MVVEKEQAFKELIDKHLDKGWIEPSESKWGS
jgi:hypothetical protein